MSSIGSAIVQPEHATEDAGRSKLHKVRRRTLSLVSLSDVRPIHRSQPRSGQDDLPSPRPIWVDSDDEEEGLPERFIFTTKDPAGKKGSKRKSIKNSALLSPRTVLADKENEPPSNSQASGVGQPSHQLGLSSGKSHNTPETQPLESESVRSSWADLPPPPEPRPVRYLSSNAEVGAPPPPLPPRDHYVHYGLGLGRARSRTYTDPSELRKAGLLSASVSSLPALSPLDMRPSAPSGTRSMYEMSTGAREADLTQSQPVCLTRSCNAQLDRHPQQPSAKDSRRQEKLMKKQQKELEKERKKIEKRMLKEHKKSQKEERKHKGRKQSAYFVDPSPPPPRFDESRAQVLL